MASWVPGLFGSSRRERRRVAAPGNGAHALADALQYTPGAYGSVPDSWCTGETEEEPVTQAAICTYFAVGDAVPDEEPTANEPVLARLASDPDLATAAVVGSDTGVGWPDGAAVVNGFGADDPNDDVVVTATVVAGQDIAAVGRRLFRQVSSGEFDGSSVLVSGAGGGGTGSGGSSGSSRRAGSGGRSEEDKDPNHVNRAQQKARQHDEELFGRKGDQGGSGHAGAAAEDDGEEWDEDDSIELLPIPTPGDGPLPAASNVRNLWDAVSNLHKFNVPQREQLGAHYETAKEWWALAKVMEHEMRIAADPNSVLKRAKCSSPQEFMKRLRGCCELALDLNPRYKPAWLMLAAWLGVEVVRDPFSRKGKGFLGTGEIGGRAHVLASRKIWGGRFGRAVSSYSLSECTKRCGDGTLEGGERRRNAEIGSVNSSNPGLDFMWVRMHNSFKWKTTGHDESPLSPLSVLRRDLFL